MTEPEANPWQTLNVLSRAVTDATKRVERDSELNEKRIKASVEKMRWFRRAAVLSLLAAALSLFVGYQARHTADQLRTQRSQSRVIACRNENATAERVNKLNDRTQQLLRNAVAGGERTAEQETRAQAFLNAELAEYEAIKVPMRDCSPAAVEAFYSKK